MTKASGIFVLFRLLLYVYFVLNLIKLGTASSWLGFLGCSLRVKIISTPMKQGISVMNKDFFCHLTGLQIFIVHLVCCLKVKSVTDPFWYPCQEEISWRPYLIVQSEIILDNIAATEIYFSWCRTTQFGKV